MKQRKDGRWLKVITIDGKKLYFYSTASTERAAEKDIQKQILLYTEKKEKGKTFHEVLEEWKEKKMEELPITTWNKSYRAYSDALNDYFQKSIKEITAGDINRLYLILADKGYSQKTVSMYKSVLNQIFSLALIKGYVDRNFVLSVPIPKGLPKLKRKMPEDKDLKIIKEHWEGFDLLPYFLLNSGLRISEALAITDEDFNFENNIIHVDKKIIHDGNKPLLIHETKTEAGTRDVILLDRLAEKIPKFKGILFCNSDGGYLTKKQLSNRWKAWQKKYNTTVTAHQLRHGFATMLFEAGIEAKDAQDLMGHADIKTTYDIYTDIRQKRREETKNKLNQFEF